MTAVAIGSIQGSVLLPVLLRTAGSFAIGTTLLPSKANRCSVVVDFSQITDLLAIVSLDVQYAQDGLVFVPMGGFTLDIPNSGNTLGVGGVGLVDPTGVPFSCTAREFLLGQGALATRTVQGTVTLSAPATVGVNIVFW